MRNFPIVIPARGSSPSPNGAGIHQSFAFVFIQNSLSLVKEFTLFKPNVLFKKKGKRASVVRAHRRSELDKRPDRVVFAEELINKL